jgi:hypothetical protein
MLRTSRLLIGLCCTPLLASCVFLLDYDALESQGPDTAEGGSGGASAGAPPVALGGAGGEGGTGCGECDDGDPCTIDVCDETGETPECMHEATVGLQLDGFEQVVPGQQHLRVSLAAGPDAFYLSSFGITDDTPSITLYRLAADGQELESLGSDLLTGLAEGTPASNVGLVVDPTLGLAVHGFVAVKPKVGDLPPRVFHIVSRAGKTTSELVGMSYRAENPWVFPQALAIGNSVHGAWIQADGTIAVHEVGAVLQPQPFGNTALPATTLSLLATAGNQPAVMFTSHTDDGPLGAYVETRGQNRSEISECQSAPGTYVSSSVIGTPLPGLALGYITKGGDDYLTTGNVTLACGSNNQCTPVTDECDAGDLANGARNIAGATVRFDADPPGVIYSVLALPQIALKPGSDTEVEAKLSLLLGRADFSDEGGGASTTIGGSEDEMGLMVVARQDTSEELGFVGPDWPAVGILPSKQVAVAWLQRDEAAEQTELHVQRYAMCLPPEAD